MITRIRHTVTVVSAAMVLALSVVAAPSEAGAASPARGVVSIIVDGSGNGVASQWAGLTIRVTGTHGGTDAYGNTTKLAWHVDWSDGTNTAGPNDREMTYGKVRALSVIASAPRPTSPWLASEMRVTAELFDWDRRAADWVQVDQADTGWQPVGATLWTSTGQLFSYADTD